jgi:citrate synthase
MANVLKMPKPADTSTGGNAAMPPKGPTDMRNFSFPAMKGTVGPDVVDVRKLYAEHGVFTYDPGFMSTAACQSGITYIDGDKGELLYRGYPIDQLANQASYLEVCYLLMFGELPTPKQLETFENTVLEHTMVNEQVHTFFHGFRPDAHPMSIICGVTGALASFYHDSLDIHNPHHQIQCGPTVYVP